MRWNDSAVLMAEFVPTCFIHQPIRLYFPIVFDSTSDGVCVSERGKRGDFHLDRPFFRQRSFPVGFSEVGENSYRPIRIKERPRRRGGDLFSFAARARREALSARIYDKENCLHLPNKYNCSYLNVFIFICDSFRVIASEFEGGISG